MSESNSVRVALVQRTSFSTPAALNLHVLPTTSQSLRDNVGYQMSQTIRTDANIQDLVRLSLAASGGLPIEMQFPVSNEALWFLMRAVLRAVEDPQRQETLCTTASGTNTVTKAAIDFTAPAGTEIQPGDIVKIVGTSTPSQDGFRKVTAAAATTVTVDGAPWIGTSGTVTITRGARMKNGTSRYFFDVEVARLDVGLFQLFRKFAIDGCSITVSDNSITQAAFVLVGIDSIRGTEAYGLSYIQPTAGPILDALGVPVFNVGGSAYSAKSIGFTIANNVRSRTQIGTLGGTDLPFGSFMVTTRTSSYLANFVEIDNYTGNVATDMYFVMQNASNQALSFAFPRHKWADLAADTRGLNQDDLLDGTGQAIVHPTQGITMRMQRWLS